MNPWRVLCFIAVFCLDVHVREAAAFSHSGSETPGKKQAAKTAEHAAVPKHECFGEKPPCQIYANTGKKQIEDDGMRMILAAGGLIEFRAGNLVQLIAGNVLVDVSKPVKIGTPFGKFYCTDECTALVTRDRTSVKIKNLAGQWIVERLGEQASYQLKPGTQVWLSQVTEGGHAAMEFPQSLPWDSTVKSWASLYPGEPEDFKQALVKFRKVWKTAVEDVSEVHLKAADRGIASHNADLAEEAKRRKVIEKEQQDLRERFRLKTLGQ